jgi:hypothetical protein
MIVYIFYFIMVNKIKQNIKKIILLLILICIVVKFIFFFNIYILSVEINNIIIILVIKP